MVYAYPIHSLLPVYPPNWKVVYNVGRLQVLVVLTSIELLTFNITSMKSTYRIPVPKFTRALTWVSLLAFAGSAVNGAGLLNRTEYDFHNEGMHVSHFPAQEGWTINAADRDPAKVVVTQFGLDYQVPSGALVDGGTRALKLAGDTSASGQAMNNWLTYQVAAGSPIATSGPVYFAVTVEAETEGIATDPQELFLRLNGTWGLYVAVKSFADVIEITGANTPYTFDAATSYRIVGRLDVTGGTITAMKIWVNPDIGDETNPATVENLSLSVPLASLGSPLELRSQKAVTYVDDLQFADSWDAVVPPLPADPGNLVVTVPADNDLVTPGYQIPGGTVVIEVGGSDYVPDTPLAPGTPVTFKMTPDTDYVLTGWRGPVKDPTDRGSVNATSNVLGVSVDRSDFTYLGTPILPGNTKTLVVPIYSPINLRPRFEFYLPGDVRLRFSHNTGPRFRIRDGSNSTIRDRSIFAPNEIINIDTIGISSIFNWGQWLGALAAETAKKTSNLEIGVDLVGVADPDIPGINVVDVECELYIQLLDSTTWATVAEIDPLDPAPNNVEYEANNVGEGEIVPLCVFNAIIAEKAPLGLAGVLDYETLLGDSRSLFLDPRASGLPTPLPPVSSLVRDGGGAFDKANSVRNASRKMIMNLGPDDQNPINQVTVETGEQWLIENWDRDDPTAYPSENGPAGFLNWGENYYTDGNTISFFRFTGGDSGRIPVSGDVYTESCTSYSYAFDPADKVVMAGAVFICRDNFQDENPNNVPTLWANAVYDDGSTSVTAFSTNRDRFPTGERDHFFGFEAPSGKYITRLQIWARGQNARAFSRGEDLAVVLEGSSDYLVTASSINPTYGTVTGGGVIVADGGTTTLTAVPGSAPFLGWVYSCEPCAIISTDLSFDVNVYGTTQVKAVFDPHPAIFGQAASVAAPDLNLDFFGFPEFNYTVEKSTDLIEWAPASVYSGAGATITHTETLGAAPDQVYVRVNYCAK